ncbi:DMT family transporter [Hahella aquimaris]|uniref:DMT family transporter n=1 Tax=Hahella sp. HNIBRBA332 TaxID=3015983 RepID=UPI00273C161E|nr:DMT family transporter [Hahella sp. HNIBRBA332]WLQ14542.1 DMT family transporter [Hahella sp. HNIBRBA332]
MSDVNASDSLFFRIAPYLGLAGTSLFWAGNALVARGFNDSIPPLALSFHRWLVCALLISPFILRAFLRHKDLIKQHWLKISVLAFLGVATYNSLLYTSAQFTSALNITLVNSLLPVATLVLAMPLLGQRLNLKSGLGVSLAFLGALYVILHGEPSTLLSLQMNAGDSIMAAAMVIWSLYSVLLRKWAIPIPGFDLFAILLGLGLPMILPFYALEHHIKGGFEWTYDLAAVIAYVAIFPSLCAYLLWNYGVTKTSPSTAALFAYLTPLLTALLSIPFLGEHPESYHLIGGGAILAGLWLSQDMGKSVKPPIPKPRT